MRLKIIGGILSFLLIALSILLFIEDDITTKVVISPKIYSIMKSSDNELFNITILTNEIDSYHFNEDFISNINLSDEEEVIPIELVEIDKSNESYPYENEIYNFVTFKLRIGFRSDDFLLNFENAHLNIDYSNTDEISLFIGEFNYLFHNEENTDLSINNLFATHAFINDIDTASGLYLNLGNLSEYNITISSVELGASSVASNNYYLREIHDDITIEHTPEQILNIDNYNYQLYSDDYQGSILLRKYNEIRLYVPFSYKADISYLYRFYVKVNYIVNSEEKVFVIDDFPYINTSNYKLELESDYVQYEFDNWNKKLRQKL